MKTYKVRITKMPGQMNNMEYGGQANFGLDLGRRKVYSDMPDDATESIAKSMTEKDELDPGESYAVMAENNETIVGDFDQDGQLEFQTIKGDYHSAPSGGTKLTNKQAVGQSFIFPQTKKMNIKDPEVLKSFGFSPRKGGISPAEISKRFDMMNEKKILDNPNADKLQKKTAQMVKAEKENMLQKLADYVEAMKGNPQGQPNIQGSLATAAFGGYMPVAGDGYYNDMSGGDPINIQRDPELSKYRKRTPNMNSQREVADFNTVDEIVNFYRRQGYNGKSDIGEWQQWMAQQSQVDPRMRQQLVDYLRTVPLTNKGKSLYGKGATPETLSEDQLLNQFQDGKWDFRAPKFFKPATVKANREKVPFGPINVNVPTIPGTPPQIVTPPNDPQGGPPTTTTPPSSGNTVPPGKPGEPYLPYHGVQMAQTLNAFSRPIKGYFDRPFVPDFVATQAMFDQPNYDPLLSANNTRMDYMNQFGNAQAARASGSYNPELTQGLVGETQRARGNNLNIYNQTAAQNTQGYNQNMVNRMAMMKSVRDNNIRTREEMDIAKQMKFQDAMNAFGKMSGDRTELKKFLVENPQYGVTGRLWDNVTFTNPKPFGESTGSGTSSFTMDRFFEEMPALKGLYEKGDDKSKLQVNKMFMDWQKNKMTMYTKPTSSLSNMRTNSRMF